MLWLRACSKCRGDLCLAQEELDTLDVYCLQCGFRMYGSLPVATAAPGMRDEPVLRAA